MQTKMDVEHFSVSDISEEESTYYEAINTKILDTILTYYDPSQDHQENQDIYTLRIPKARHRIFNFVTTKLLRKQKKWESWEVSATNHKYSLHNGILNILVRNNVNKDSYIIFHTNAKTLLQMQNLGLTKSQALTSQVIEAAGRYQLIVETRRIESKIVTHKTSLKSNTLSELQYQIRLLQPIERLICNYSGKELNKYKQEVAQTFARYNRSLLEQTNALCRLIEIYDQHENFNPDEKQWIENILHTPLPLIEEFLSHDKWYLHNRLKSLNERFKSANNFGIDYTNSPYAAQTISDALQSFLRFNLNSLVHDAQALNDQLTHNAKDVLLHGKLRDCLVDADKIISNYIFDQLQPITYEHQSNYGVTRDGNHDATQDASYGMNNVTYHSYIHAGHSRKDLEKILLGITALEDQTKQVQDDSIRTVKSAAWNNFSVYSKKQKLRRFAAWGLTNFLHLPLSLVNLLVTALTGQSPIANFMQQTEQVILSRFGLTEDYTHDFYKFRDKLGVNNVYTSTAIGKMINKVVREVTAVVIQSPQLIVKKLIEQAQLLGKDFTTGLWGYLYQKQFAKESSPEIVRVVKSKGFAPLDKTAIKRLERLYVQAQRANKLAYVNVEDVHYAKPHQNLSPYQPHDLLSSLMSGVEGFVNFFKNDLFEKHPMTAFIAALAYGFGGSAVLSPGILKIMLAKLGMSAGKIDSVIETCHVIGKATARGDVNEAIAAGFTVAKVTGLTLNTINQGFDSVLCEVINEIRKDPLVYAAGLSLAYGFGHLLTDVITIPGLTVHLREEIGTFPAIAKVTIGSKVGVIALKSARREEQEEKSIFAHFIGDLTKLGLIALRAALSVISLSPRPWIDLGKYCFRGLVIGVHFVNRLSVLTAQMLMQIPKTLIEVGTTLLVNTLKLVHLITMPLHYKNVQSVIGVGPLLHGKHDALQAGYNLGFEVRDKFSRKPERVYGKIIKSMDIAKQAEKAESSHGFILSNLSSRHNKNELVLTDSDEVIHKEIDQPSFKGLPGLKKPIDKTSSHYHDKTVKSQFSKSF